MIGAGWPVWALPSEACKHEPSRLGAIDLYLSIEEQTPIRCCDLDTKPIVGLYAEDIDPQHQSCRIRRERISHGVASADRIDLWFL